MPIAGALAVAPSIAGTAFNIGAAVKAAIQQKRDKEELARLKTPYYKIQNEYFQNTNGAASLAQGGLTQGAKDLYTDEINRGLGTGISAINEAGGSPNDIARLFDSYSSGLHRLSTEDAQRQIENIKYYHQANRDLAGQKTMQWDINEYQPYQNKLKELTQRIGADKQNIFGGIQAAIGSGQSIVTGLQNNSLLGKLFGQKQQEQSPLATVADPFTNEQGFNPMAKSSNPYNWYQPQSNVPPMPTNTDNGNPDRQKQLEDIINYLNSLKEGNA